MARSMLLMASTSMLKGRGQVEFLRGARGKRLCAVVPPSSRVQLQAGPLQSSKLVSDQLPELLAGGEQLLSIAGVNTRDPRISLAFSVATQASRKLEQGLLSAAGEARKYTSGARKQDDPSSWEELFMSVPDLETIPYRVVQKVDGLEIREVESYLVAETRMPSAQGFDFGGSSQSFNTLAGYLFGKNKARQAMEMTTPVVSQRTGGQAMEMTTPVITSRQGQGTAMEMTTPVISSKEKDTSWSMAFVIPSAFNEETVPVPEDAGVTIRRIPAKTVAVSVFSGYVLDADVARRERILRETISRLPGYTVAPGAALEVSQFNPPFTLPFMRRNEISLEVVPLE